jgi:mercuric reductase
MDPKVETALNRLNSILPLKQRQDDCNQQIKELHQQILRSFIDRGRILTRKEMQQRVSNLEETVKTFKEKDMVIFSEDDKPVGAYPFTMEAREHNIRVNGHQVYAMCALDALAVAPMFGMDTQITSRCSITGDPVYIQQSGKIIVNLDEAGDIRFGIAWSAANADLCCADSLCLEMIFLRDGETAQRWLADGPENREVFSLRDAVEFGDRFFSPLLA